MRQQHSIRHIAYPGGQASVEVTSLWFMRDACSNLYLYVLDTSRWGGQ